MSDDYNLSRGRVFNKHIRALFYCQNRKETNFSFYEKMLKLCYKRNTSLSTLIILKSQSIKSNCLFIARNKLDF